MTSREHARRLMLILLASEGSALRQAADERTLLIAQGSSAGLGALNPTTGKIYSVEIRPDGSPGIYRRLATS